MQIELLCLSHREILTAKFKNLNVFLSEYSFSNLYLFRALHQYQVLMHEKEIFIQGMTRDLTSFIMPTSESSQSFEILKSILKKDQIVFPIPEEWLNQFPKEFFSYNFKEEDSDYLYTLTKLAHYPGRHLSDKRNLVKQLFENHQIAAKPLENHLDLALKILENWQNESPLNETDYQSCLEALQEFKELKLFGRIIFVNQKPAGFTVGDWLNEKCFVLLFSKGTHSIKGLNQYLYQDLALQLENDRKEWINLEQDLGLLSLRQAKKSYLPDRLLHKWRVKIIK